MKPGESSASSNPLRIIQGRDHPVTTCLPNLCYPATTAGSSSSSSSSNSNSLLSSCRLALTKAPLPFFERPPPSQPEQQTNVYAACRGPCTFESGLRDSPVRAATDLVSVEI